MVGFRDCDKAVDQSMWVGSYEHIPVWSPHSLLPLEVAKRFDIFNRELGKLSAPERERLFASTMIVDDSAWMFQAEQFLRYLSDGTFRNASLGPLRETASLIAEHLVRRSLHPKGDHKKAEEIVAKIQDALAALETQQKKRRLTIKPAVSG
jgi:hypothetical protein